MLLLLFDEAPQAPVTGAAAVNDGAELVAAAARVRIGAQGTVADSGEVAGAASAEDGEQLTGAAAVLGAGTGEVTDAGEIVAGSGGERIRPIAPSVRSAQAGTARCLVRVDRDLRVAPIARQSQAAKISRGWRRAA